MSVEEDEGHKVVKGEQCLETSSVGSQPLGGEEDLSPFIYVRRPSRYELTLSDSYVKFEAPQSRVRERNPPKKFPNFMELMSSINDSKYSII
jgi:hypothetical protein